MLVFARISDNPKVKIMNMTKIEGWFDRAEYFLEKNYMEMYMIFLFSFTSCLIWVVFPTKYEAGFLTTLYISFANGAAIWFTIVSGALIAFPIKYEGEQARAVGSLITSSCLKRFFFIINLALVLVSIVFTRDMIVAFAYDNSDNVSALKGILGISIGGTLGGVLLYKYRWDRISSEKEAVLIQQPVKPKNFQKNDDGAYIIPVV